jgi:hypothetical protein
VASGILGSFFNEFALRGRNVAAALQRAESAGILAGVPLGRWFPSSTTPCSSP